MPETRQNGPAIITYREMRGMNRNDLVKKITEEHHGGVSYPYLANIENENKSATPAVLHRIALALDVPVAAIARGPIYDQAEEAAS